jgi:3(or 17)beta-hydroxysteroid dehydrogenase
MQLQGKTAVVTGAARGIGATSARLLAAHGAQVFIADLLEEEGSETARRIIADGGKATFLKLDVTDEANWQHAFRRIHAAAPAIDIMVNNAGLFSYSMVEETSTALYERLCGVNLKGVLLGTKYAILSMKERPRTMATASIVNMSSIAGLVGSPFSSIYSMTKGGVRLFTKATALEVAQLQYNIRCNSVHPGIVETDMAAMVSQHPLAAQRGVPDISVLAGMHPLGRIGQSADIANGVLFLASEQSAFMTGAELVLDGGITAR